MKRRIISLKHIYLYCIVLLLLSVVNNIGYAQETDKIYWTTRDKIMRANLDGTDVEDIVTDLILPQSLIIDEKDGKLYWIEDFRNLIKRANLDGSDVELIFDRDRDKLGVILVSCMAIDRDGKKIYWTGERFINTPTKLIRANLDGTDVEEFILKKEPTNPRSMALDMTARKIYWLNLNFNFISRTDLDGSNVEDLFLGAIGSEQLELDVANNMMYWFNNISDTIKKSSLNGENVGEFGFRLSNPKSIALDKRSRHIYWLESAKVLAGKIGRANLDGTNVIDVLTDLEFASSIALYKIKPFEVSLDKHKLTTTWGNIKVRSRL